jgi:hypothetical protein
VPDNRDPAIPIASDMKEVGTHFMGDVKTSGPFKADSHIDYGSNINGLCNLSVVLSMTVRLRLYGSCEPTTFSGYCTLYDAQKRSATGGSFRLTRKSAASADLDGAGGTATATATASACLKTNAQWLAVCPREDSGAELLCANHRRAKLKSCKGRSKKLAPPAE